MQPTMRTWSLLLNKIRLESTQQFQLLCYMNDGNSCICTALQTKVLHWFQPNFASDLDSSTMMYRQTYSSHNTLHFSHGPSNNASIMHHISHCSKNNFYPNHQLKPSQYDRHSQYCCIPCILDSTKSSCQYSVLSHGSTMSAINMNDNL